MRRAWDGARQARDNNGRSLPAFLEPPRTPGLDPHVSEAAAPEMCVTFTEGPLEPTRSRTQEPVGRPLRAAWKSRRSRTQVGASPFLRQPRFPHVQRATHVQTDPRRVRAGPSRYYPNINRSPDLGCGPRWQNPPATVTASFVRPTSTRPRARPRAS